MSSNMVTPGSYNKSKGGGRNSSFVKVGKYSLKTGVATGSPVKLSYEIWMMQEGKESKAFQLPVNPENYSYTQSTNDKTVTRVGAESATIRMGKAPHVLSFSSYFPNPDSVTDGELEITRDKLKDPMEYVSLIEKFKEGKARVWVTITGAAGIAAGFSITSFKTEEKGGDVGTIFYSITLKTKPKISIEKSTSDLVVYTDSGSILNRPKKYKVKKGDTWKTIAKQFYGSSKASVVKKLKNANKKKKKVVKLKAGITIKLP